MMPLEKVVKIVAPPEVVFSRYSGEPVVATVSGGVFTLPICPDVKTPYLATFLRPGKCVEGVWVRKASMRVWGEPVVSISETHRCAPSPQLHRNRDSQQPTHIYKVCSLLWSHDRSLWPSLSDFWQAKSIGEAEFP